MLCLQSNSSHVPSITHLQAKDSRKCHFGMECNRIPGIPVTHRVRGELWPMVVDVSYVDGGMACAGQTHA